MRNKNEYIKICEIKDKQKLLLVLLGQFHEICEENNLIYNIFGGTLLGAVRHKGIIPWDDDIDVTMPREDYIKFLDIINRDYSESFELYAYPRKNYIYPYAKLGMKGTVIYENVVKSKYNKLSLNIDIFPNDGYPKDENILDKYNELEQKIILCSYRLKYPKNPIKALKLFFRKVFAKTFGINYFLKKQIEIVTSYKIEDCDYMLCQGAGWGRKGKLLKEVYYERCLYDFNGMKVWGQKNYNEQLSEFYGDYMTPPPLENQKPPHDSELYISKKIYQKYIRSE